MTTTLTTNTVRSLLTFIFENPGSTPQSAAQEFSIVQTDAEELLSKLDEDDQ